MSERSVIVVGAGLVGSALARRLAERGLAPVCFGPQVGPPYSSHDDSGRITRILDGSPVWAQLAARAIESYSDIEARSGIRFHHPVGVLWSARTPEPLAELGEVRSTFEIETGSGLGGWEGIADLAGDMTILERGAAGHIAPKQNVRAHRALALRNGAVFDDRGVVALEQVGDRWAVRLSDGASAMADRVVIAAGAGSRELVDVGLDVTGEVVVHAQIPPATGARLADLPCIGRLSADSVVEGYLTPPIRDQLGWHIKFGAEQPATSPLPTAQAVAEWMSGDAHRDRLPAMAAALRRLLPGIEFGEIRAKPCLYARTASGLPIIDEVEPGLIVVTGGNGRMAKSADAVAALAVPVVTDGRWLDQQLDSEMFRGAAATQ